MNMTQELVQLAFGMGLIFGIIIMLAINLFFNMLKKAVNKEKQRKERFFKKYGKEALKAYTDWEEEAKK